MKNSTFSSWTLRVSAWCVLIACLTCTARADAKLEGTNPAQWRVVWTADPSTSARICWSTAEPGQAHTVQYGVRGQDTDLVVECHRNGQYTRGDTYYHHATLKDLNPNTFYEIELVSDDTTSPKLYFRTAPSTDRPLSVVFGGDSRSDRAARRDVNQLIATLLAESAKSEDPGEEILAFAHGGDFVLHGTSYSQWTAWMSDHELTATGDQRLLPIIPTRGNHDRGDLFNEVFGFPADDLNFYAINLGPKIRLVTLNTETSAGGDQAEWLESELAESRAANRWLLAQYHRPAFPAVKQPSRALQHWVPLFEKHDVDLVCEADGHVIKRTVPIRDNKHDPTGVVYIGEGGLGVPQRSPNKDRWFLREPGMVASGHHVQLLRFTDKKLRYQCVLLDGEILDTYTRSVR